MDGNPAPLMGALANVPPVKRHRSKGRNSPYPFEDMARLAKANPGKSILAAESVPLNKIKSVREYRGDPFEDATGRIQIEMRNSQVGDNKRYGDVYMTWIDPTTVMDRTSVPPPARGRYRAKGRNSPYPFEDVARLARTTPGIAILAATEVPMPHIKSLRYYRGDPFEDATGRIQIEMRNSRVVDEERHGDVYLTWTDPTITVQPTVAPPVKRHTAKDRNSPYPFEDMARLAKANPGKPILAAESVPINKIKSVREYRRDPFEDTSGRIQVEMRNSRVVDNKRYGDVYLTWIDLTTAGSSSTA